MRRHETLLLRRAQANPEKIWSRGAHLILQLRKLFGIERTKWRRKSTDDINSGKAQLKHFRHRFRNTLMSAEENERWAAALKLGATGRDVLRGQTLDHYVTELDEARRATLEMLATRDDAWLDRSVRVAPRINAHWAWFHVAEEEINHRGQIRWLRARLPKP